MAKIQIQIPRNNMMELERHSSNNTFIENVVCYSKFQTVKITIPSSSSFHLAQPFKKESSKSCVKLLNH
jgi:hypothetical protein